MASFWKIINMIFWIRFPLFDLAMLRWDAEWRSQDTGDVHRAAENDMNFGVWVGGAGAIRFDRMCVCVCVVEYQFIRNAFLERPFCVCINFQLNRIHNGCAFLSSAKWINGRLRAVHSVVHIPFEKHKTFIYAARQKTPQSHERKTRAHFDAVVWVLFLSWFWSWSNALVRSKASKESDCSQLRVSLAQMPVLSATTITAKLTAQVHTMTISPRRCLLWDSKLI